MIKQITLFLIASSILVFSTVSQSNTDVVKDVNIFNYSFHSSPILEKLLGKTVYDVFAGDSCSITCDDGSSCSTSCQKDGEYAYCRCGGSGAYCTCNCNKIGGCN
jgi:hypothetical protein